MARKNITVSVGHESPYTFEGKLKQVRARIDEMIEQHGEDAVLDWNAHFFYPYDESPSPRFEVLVTRPETEEEMFKREAEEENLRKQQEARERREYERLQAKFKGN